MPNVPSLSASPPLTRASSESRFERTPQRVHVRLAVNGDRVTLHLEPRPGSPETISSAIARTRSTPAPAGRLPAAAMRDALAGRSSRRMDQLNRSHRFLAEEVRRHGNPAQIEQMNAFRAARDAAVAELKRNGTPSRDQLVAIYERYQKPMSDLSVAAERSRQFDGALQTLRAQADAPSELLARAAELAAGGDSALAQAVTHFTTDNHREPSPEEYAHLQATTAAARYENLMQLVLRPSSPGATHPALLAPFPDSPPPEPYPPFDFFHGHN